MWSNLYGYALAYAPATTGVGGAALLEVLPQADGKEGTLSLVLRTAIALFGLVTTIISHRKLNKHIAEQKQQLSENKNGEK